MQIERSGYFYAAHRNQHLRGDKCRALHGHTYYLDVCFIVPDEGDNGVTVLFSELESMINKLTSKLDHSVLCDEGDEALVMSMRLLSTQDMADAKVVYFPHATSAEMLAKWFYEKLAENNGIDIAWVRMRETQSSTVIYRKADHEKIQGQ